MERKYWSPEVETIPLDRLRKLQEERLKGVVAHAYEKTAFYRQRFDKAGVKPEDIKTLDDLKKFPLIHSSEDFRKAPVAERLGVPFSEVKYVESSSGTTGIPMVMLWSKRDWEDLQEGEARARWIAGVRPQDRVHLLTGFPCCQGGHQKLGATVIALSAGRGNLDNQIRVGEMAGVNVLEQLPSLALKYFERAKEMGIELGIRLVVSIGEGFAEAYRRKVESEYGVQFRSVYGSVDAGLVAAECEAGDGMHLFGDLCLVEVIDPETLEVLSPGKEGELVLTLLWNEATPIIRYRTGDVASLLPHQPCPCGRTHPKMSLVKGRLSLSLKVKGKRIFPIDVEEVIVNIPGLGEEYQIIRDKPGELDRLKVKVEAKPEVKDWEEMRKRVEQALNQNLGVESQVELVPLGTFGRALYKAQRIITT